MFKFFNKSWKFETKLVVMIELVSDYEFDKSELWKTKADNNTKAWCPEEDSNLHTLRHTDLNRARLPIPPSGLFDEGAQFNC